MDRLAQSFDIIKSSRTTKNVWKASPSVDYGYIWIRDNFYISLSYVNKSCDTYETTYHAILDILTDYQWKLDYHIKHKPKEMWEYLNIRYDAETHKEIDTPWAHAQNDCIGDILFGIGLGIKKGKQMLRDEKDKEILQKLVWYLNTLEYWRDEESGAWEEMCELRSSSIGACVAGLEAVSDIVYVPAEMIRKGRAALYSLLPSETPTRDCDLALLSLIYPYNLLPKPMAQEIIHNVETKLMKNSGVIRYQSDSYYSTLEKEYGRYQPKEFYIGSEGAWCMGFPWLSACFSTLGDYEKAKYYLDKTESLMLEDGSLPEIIMADGTINPNTPLIWGNALFTQAYEKISK